jgi:hypothetical protein
VNGHRLYYWAICSAKINSKLLVETFGNEKTFVAINRAITFAFEVKHPLASNCVLVQGCTKVQVPLLSKASN